MNQKQQQAIQQQRQPDIIQVNHAKRCSILTGVGHVSGEVEESGSDEAADAESQINAEIVAGGK